MTDPVEPVEASPAVLAAERLASSMAGLRTEMADLKAYGSRNRHFIRLLTASIIFDVVLSVALGWIGIRAYDASSAATAATAASKVNANNQHQSCLNGNEVRAVQLELWTNIFDLTGANGAPRTPEQEARIETFRRYVNDTFSQRTCP